MAGSTHLKYALLFSCILVAGTEAGVIKNLFQKLTGNSNNQNRPEGADTNSALICGGGLFKSPDEGSLSPEIIFITNRPSRTSGTQNSNYNNGRQGRRQEVSEVAREFSFHEENVTLAELERYGFNRDAPTSFLMHGFTSGYPLQAWMSAIVEAYTIDRQTQGGNSNHHGGNHNNDYGSQQGSGSTHNQGGNHHNGESNYNGHDNQYGGSNNHNGNNYEGSSYNGHGSQYQGNNNNEYGNGGYSYGQNGNQNGNHQQSGSSQSGFNNGRWRNSSSSHHSYNRRDTAGGYERDRGQRDRGQRDNGQRDTSSGKRVNHNLFVVNWNYAARGILYPRAVANIPTVASYLARFINEKLLDEARMDPTHIQLIGHSLGAHLAGFTAKNTKERMGRIYGLDPAGPCFGTIAGSLFPASKRLDPSDAEEVITIHTNSALLGIDKAIGHYSVYVEGGENQPGCRTGGVLKTITTLTVDQANADAIACSHSRAPNLLTYRHDQSDHDDDCQLIAYGCKDWNSYKIGHCGVCDPNIIGSDNEYSRQRGRGRDQQQGPLKPVACLRIGLDWQYPKKGAASNGRPSQSGGYRPTNDYGNSGYDGSGGNNENYENNRPSRRPSGGFSSSSYDREDDQGQSGRYTSSRRPTQPFIDDDSYDRRTSSRRPYSPSSSSSSSSNGDYNQSGYGYQSSRRPSSQTSSYGYGSSGRDEYDRQSSTRRPYSQSSSSSSYGGDHDGYGHSVQGGSNYDTDRYNDRSTRRPGYSPSSYDRQRRAANTNSTSSSNSSASIEPTERRGNDQSIKPVVMFLKTGDTQPFCTFQYQVVLELNEPFNKNQPPMSLVLQDSEPEHQGGGQNVQGPQKKKEQASIVDDEFGRKYDDRTYTQLVTSNQKLKKIDHATLLFRLGLPNGHRILKKLHVNYMSHINPEVRRRLSATLCPVRTDQDRGRERDKANADTRFYFKPCDGRE